MHDCTSHSLPALLVSSAKLGGPWLACHCSGFNKLKLSTIYVKAAFVAGGGTPRRCFTTLMLFLQDLDEYAECDVVITGAGSAGLCCAYELSKHPDIKVAIIEQGEQLCAVIGLKFCCASFQSSAGNRMAEVLLGSPLNVGLSKHGCWVPNVMQLSPMCSSPASPCDVMASHVPDGCPPPCRCCTRWRCLAGRSAVLSYVCEYLSTATLPVLNPVHPACHSHSRCGRC